MSKKMAQGRVFALSPKIPTYLSTMSWLNCCSVK